MPAPYSGKTSTGQRAKTTTQLSGVASRFRRQSNGETSREQRGTLQRFLCGLLQLDKRIDGHILEAAHRLRVNPATPLLHPTYVPLKLPNPSDTPE
jgi:hypothetical protein